MKFNKLIKYLFPSLLFCLLIQSSLSGQITNRENEKLSNIFHEIERDINNGDVAGLSRYFNTRVFVSLPTNINDYFSSNHLYYILKDYFSTHRAMYFAFDKLSITNSNSFGYGKLTYQYKEERKHSTIYIAFGKFGDDWKITQLTVN